MAMATTRPRRVSDDSSYRRRTFWPIAQDSTAKLCLSLSIPQRDSTLSHQIILLSNEFLGHCKFSRRSLASTSLLFLFLFFFYSSSLDLLLAPYSPFLLHSVFFLFFFLPFFFFFSPPFPLLCPPFCLLFLFFH